MTPSPWTTHTYEGGMHVITDAAGGMVAKVIVSNPNDLAVIGAAREMMEALAPFARLLDNFSENLGLGTGDFIKLVVPVAQVEAARAALAKAKGARP